MKKNTFILFIIILITLTILTIIFNKEDNNFKNGKLYISEILVNNKNIIKDNYGEYSDYIEIYNDSNLDINLEGYYLSDQEFTPKKYVLPEVIIKAKSYLLIYCSGKDKIDNDYIHTNFKLNDKGETVVFTDKNGNILSKINYGTISSDTSISYINNEYVNSTPSPLKENIKITKTDYSNISINEYMTHNKIINLTNGGYYDFIEIYNNGDKVNLENLYLSDDLDNLYKYKFPNIDLDKDEYLVVYLTGGEKIDNYLCADFKLSDEDKYLILSSNGKIIEKIELTILEDNISYGKYDNKWYYFSKPTPGKINNTAKFETLGGTNGSS